MCVSGKIVRIAKSSSALLQACLRRLAQRCEVGSAGSGVRRHRGGCLHGAVSDRCRRTLPPKLRGVPVRSAGSATQASGSAAVHASEMAAAESAASCSAARSCASMLRASRPALSATPSAQVAARPTSEPTGGTSNMSRRCWAVGPTAHEGEQACWASGAPAPWRRAGGTGQSCRTCRPLARPPPQRPQCHPPGRREARSAAAPRRHENARRRRKPRRQPQQRLTPHPRAREKPAGVPPQQHPHMPSSSLTAARRARCAATLGRPAAPTAPG